jgi:hypothetical protein
MLLGKGAPAQEGHHVFKEWAESWARRAVIQNAIRMIRPLKAAVNCGAHSELFRRGFEFDTMLTSLRRT